MPTWEDCPHKFMNPDTLGVPPIAGSVGHLPAHYGVSACVRERSEAMSSGVLPKIRTEYPHFDALSP